MEQVKIFLENNEIWWAFGAFVIALASLLFAIYIAKTTKDKKTNPTQNINNKGGHIRGPVTQEIHAAPAGQDNHDER